MTSKSELEPKFAPKEPYELQGGVYAWGRTARLIAEPAYLKARDQAKGDFIAVDLCSSFPYFREIMTGQRRQEMHTLARVVTGKFVDDLHAPPKKNKLPFTKNVDTDALVSLRKTLGPRHDLPRQLLTAPVFEMLANPPSGNKRDIKSIADTLFEKFKGSKTRYQFIYEPTGRPGEKGTWAFIAPVESNFTLQQIIGPILGEKTLSFLQNISLYFGQKLSSENSLRRVTFLSLDYAPFNELVENARKGFPPKLQNTLFFRSIQEPKRHMCADIRLLRFRKNGIGFFSSIEGWPYYGGSFGFDRNMDVARRIASQLAEGGKAVFFPWNMQENHSFSQELLCKVEKEWLSLGLTIDKTSSTVDQLLAGMTDRELVLANHSPILQQTEAIESLVLSKPNL